MTKRLNPTGAVLLTVAATLCSAGNACAQELQLTTRVMMMFDSTAAVDWDQAESLALVVLPQQLAAEPVVREIAVPDPDVVTTTLAERFPDVDEEQITWLAEQLLSAFEPQGDENILRASFVTAPVAHVTTVGTEFLNGDPDLVFWDGSAPPSGATAQSGLRGDVLVLGEFCVRLNLDGTNALPIGTWIVCEESESTISVQAAIGLFTE